MLQPVGHSRRDARRLRTELVRGARERVKRMPGKWRRYLWKHYFSLAKSFWQAAVHWIFAGIVLASAIGIVGSIMIHLEQRADDLTEAQLLAPVLLLWATVTCALPQILVLLIAAPTNESLAYYPTDINRATQRQLLQLFGFFAVLLTLLFCPATTVLAEAARARSQPLPLHWGLAAGLALAGLALLPSILLLRFYRKSLQWVLLGLAILLALQMGIATLDGLGMLQENPMDPNEIPIPYYLYRLRPKLTVALLTRLPPAWVLAAGRSLAKEINLAAGLQLAAIVGSCGLLGAAGGRFSFKRLAESLVYRDPLARRRKKATKISDHDKLRLRRRFQVRWPDLEQEGWFGTVINRILSLPDKHALTFLLQGRSQWRLRWYLALAVLVVGHSGWLLPETIRRDAEGFPYVIYTVGLVIATIVFLPVAWTKPGMMLPKRSGPRTAAFAYLPLDLTKITGLLLRILAVRCLSWFLLLTALLICSRLPKPLLWISYVGKGLWFSLCVSTVVTVSGVVAGARDAEFLPIRNTAIHGGISICCFGGHMLALGLLCTPLLPFDRPNTLILNLIGVALVPIVSALQFFSYRWYYRCYLDLLAKQKRRGGFRRQTA